MTEQNRNYIKKEIGKLLSDICGSRAGRAGVWARAPHYQEAGRHACGCADTVAAELLKTNMIGSEKQHNRVSAESTLTTASSAEEPVHLSGWSDPARFPTQNRGKCKQSTGISHSVLFTGTRSTARCWD